MFNKILIANRGEIACRVMRTAKRLGVATVAVYSDADAEAMHVAMADEACRIGPPPAAESYLNVEAIVEACLASGAEAAHPGYGFLSENPAFVEALEAAGLTFIGPPASAIRAMGLKDAAKALMERAGVPVVPGYHGENQDPAYLADRAAEIGYPVLIKARAGGGGKGMRRVDDPADFGAALESAGREAMASFGDGRCLIEKYLAKPRHIEIQVFGDSLGSVVHLFERDCSLQRRHQKVIEEAPAPGMTEAVRAAMGEAAVRAAKAVGYVNAGTVEFIADVSEGLREDRFYFMEMNTRLQVEHPVTEAIVGQDLVEWQLRIAAGEPLPRSQEALSIDGWAFEARIYAEDPTRNFLPATGRLDYLSFPEGSARIDSGVRQGDAIAPHYDPMIAKLIVHGPTREAALAKLARSLGECHVVGLVANIPFLLTLAAHPNVMRGDVDVGLIDRERERITARPEAPPEARALAALSALGLLDQPSQDDDPWSALIGWRLWSSARAVAVLADENGPFEIGVDLEQDGGRRVETPAGTIEIDDIETDGRGVRCSIGRRRISATIVRVNDVVAVFMDGFAFDWILLDPLARAVGAEAETDRLVAPMPGLVKLVDASPGARVRKDAPLIVMEAMKMEHALKAPRDGIVGEVAVCAGDQVEEGAVLLTLAAPSDEAA
jgi:3-methylcrotonyl-CoA carboxylase alpha subunit